MTVVNYTANQLWLQLVKNQQKINFLAVALLAIFLLSYAAELTWRVWPQPADNGRLKTISSGQPVILKNSNSRELGRLTTTQLTIGNSVNSHITVHGITDGNSDSVGTINLVATASGAMVVFDGGDSEFDKAITDGSG